MTDIWWLKVCRKIWVGYIQFLHKGLEHLDLWSWMFFPTSRPVWLISSVTTCIPLPSCCLFHEHKNELLSHFSGLVRGTSVSVFTTWFRDDDVPCKRIYRISTARRYISYYILCSGTIQHCLRLPAENSVHLDSAGYGVCTCAPDVLRQVESLTSPPASSPPPTMCRWLDQCSAQEVINSPSSRV